MNSVALTPPNDQPAQYRVEFFRLPAPGKRDPFFGLSRGWYYKAAAAGEIRMVAIRNRGSVRGVRLVSYDSVLAYIQRSMLVAGDKSTPTQSDQVVELTAEVDEAKIEVARVTKRDPNLSQTEFPAAFLK